jgi:hypothetical protein
MAAACYEFTIKINVKFQDPQPSEDDLEEALVEAERAAVDTISSKIPVTEELETDSDYEGYDGD